MRVVIRRNIGFGICLLSMMLAACSAVRTAADFKKPDVQMVGANVTGLNFDSANLDLLLAVNNPNPAGFKLQRFDYQVDVAGSSLFSGQQQTPTAIAAAGQSDVAIPVSLKFADAYKLMASLREEEEMPYTVSGTAYLDLPIVGAQAFPVKYSGKLPLPKLPLVRLVDLSVDGLSPDGAAATVVLEVDNPNSFAFDINKLSYTLGLNGAPGIQAAINSIQQVGGKQTSQIKIPVAINFNDVGKAFVGALASGKRPDYSLHGSMSVDTALPAMKNVPVFFAQQGTLPK